MITYSEFLNRFPDGAELRRLLAESGVDVAPGEDLWVVGYGVLIGEQVPSPGSEVKAKPSSRRKIRISSVGFQSVPHVRRWPV